MYINDFTTPVTAHDYYFFIIHGITLPQSKVMYVSFLKIMFLVYYVYDAMATNGVSFNKSTSV